MDAATGDLQTYSTSPSTRATDIFGKVTAEVATLLSFIVAPRRHCCHSLLRRGGACSFGIHEALRTGGPVKKKTSLVEYFTAQRRVVRHVYSPPPPPLPISQLTFATTTTRLMKRIYYRTLSVSETVNTSAAMAKMTYTPLTAIIKLQPIPRSLNV